MLALGVSPYLSIGCNLFIYNIIIMSIFTLIYYDNHKISSAYPLFSQTLQRDLLTADCWRLVSFFHIIRTKMATPLVTIYGSSEE